MKGTESRRDFMKKGLAAGVGLAGLSNTDTGKAISLKRLQNTNTQGNIIVEKAKKIYSSPEEVPFKYCGWTDIVFWHGKYYCIFSRKTRHIATPPDGPGLVVIESTDLENWTEQQLADMEFEYAPSVDGAMAKLAAGNGARDAIVLPVGGSTFPYLASTV